MIIGITGFLGAGKDTVAEYLISKSFYHVSLSDILREELERRKIPKTRENQVKVANELRERFGTSYLAEQAERRLTHDKHWVITSIRNKGELNHFAKRKDFIMVFIDAPLKKRYERIAQRKSSKDTKTLAEFKRDEEQELQGKAHEQNLLQMKRLSRIAIDNGGSLEELHEKLDQMLQDLYVRLKIPRPGWDEYYLNIAQAVARRSNCMKRKVAAVVVKDNRIISTGYNGTPRGVKNCDEGGCKRCNSFAKGGTNLGECVCSHGEENAIVQAAYHGISLKGSTMYTTMSPCITCTKMIINAGIRKVIYNTAYPLAEESLRLLKEAKVELVKVDLSKHK